MVCVASSGIDAALRGLDLRDGVRAELQHVRAVDDVKRVALHEAAVIDPHRNPAVGARAVDAGLAVGVVDAELGPLEGGVALGGGLAVAGELDDGDADGEVLLVLGGRDGLVAVELDALDGRVERVALGRPRLLHPVGAGVEPLGRAGEARAARGHGDGRHLLGAGLVGVHAVPRALEARGVGAVALGVQRYGVAGALVHRQVEAVGHGDRGVVEVADDLALDGADRAGGRGGVEHQVLAVALAPVDAHVAGRAAQGHVAGGLLPHEQDVALGGPAREQVLLAAEHPDVAVRERPGVEGLGVGQAVLVGVARPHVVAQRRVGDAGLVDERVAHERRAVHAGAGSCLAVVHGVGRPQVPVLVRLEVGDEGLGVEPEPLGERDAPAGLVRRLPGLRERGGRPGEQRGRRQQERERAPQDLLGRVRPCLVVHASLRSSWARRARPAARPRARASRPRRARRPRAP